MSAAGALTFWHEPNTSYQTVTISTSIEDDTWHLIYAVIMGASTSTCTIQLFIDGGLFAQSSESSTISSANFLGSSTSVTHYSIGNVRSYRSVFTYIMIQWLRKNITRIITVTWFGLGWLE